MVDTDRDFITALLVPVYNGAKYVEQFHRSVLQLETKFNDVVFYNDGSTDDSYSLIKDLGYKIINGASNQGCAFARNQLIRSTDAEWVHFHDIDDLLCPDYLTFKLQAVKYNYDAIFCDADWLDTNTGNIMLRWRYNNDELRKNGASYFLNNPVGGINGLYKRDTLIKIGGFDENLKVWEDADLNLRIYLHDQNVYFTENVLVKSLRYAGSTSSNELKRQTNHYSFLIKHVKIEDPVFKAVLLKEANNLYHAIVYSKNWDLYQSILYLFNQLNIKPPVTHNVFLNFFKNILGPKNFTLIKYSYLKHIAGLKI